MPTYTYCCDDCSHSYDAFHAMKDDPHTICPECGGKVQRQIGSGAGIVFKGSGFYVTDYKKSSAPAGESAGSDGGSSGPASSTSGSASSASGSDSGAS